MFDKTSLEGLLDTVSLMTGHTYFVDGAQSYV